MTGEWRGQNFPKYLHLFFKNQYWHKAHSSINSIWFCQTAMDHSLAAAGGIHNTQETGLAVPAVTQGWKEGVLLEEKIIPFTVNPSCWHPRSSQLWLSTAFTDVHHSMSTWNLFCCCCFCVPGVHNHLPLWQTPQGDHSNLLFKHSGNNNGRC